MWTGWNTVQYLPGTVLEAAGRHDAAEARGTKRRHPRVLAPLEDHSDARRNCLDLVRALCRALCMDGAPLTRTHSGTKAGAKRPGGLRA